MRFLSQLYAFMYWSKRRTLLGFAIGSWIRLLPVVLFLVGLVQGWPLFLNIFWLTVAFLLIVFYAVGRRAGYKRFLPEPKMALDDDFAAPTYDQRVPVRATGLFSVQSREAYLLERPTSYWRVPHGQHVLMAEERAGRYLYQIINPQHIEFVEPGHLLFGREPQPALAVHFIPTWGPEFAVDPTYYDTGPIEEEAEADRERRVVYLTFDHDADRYAVWKSLLQTEKQAHGNS